MRTYYEVLDLPPDADEQSVKSAYRALARRFHPDLNGGAAASAERLAEINHAYATLGNPDARAAYDRDMAQRRATTRRRYAIFGAISLVIFVVTAGAVSLAVRRQLADSAAAVSPPHPPAHDKRKPRSRVRRGTPKPRSAPRKCSPMNSPRSTTCARAPRTAAWCSRISCGARTTKRAPRRVGARSPCAHSSSRLPRTQVPGLRLGRRTRVRPQRRAVRLRSVRL